MKEVIKWELWISTGSSTKMSWYLKLDFCNLLICQLCLLYGNIRQIALFSRELVLLERSHELGRQTERSEAQGTLSATTDIVNKSNCPLVHLLLVKELVLNHVHVDKVAHVHARVPTDVVRIDVDLAKHPDHLCLVGHVGLRTGSSSGRVGRSGVKVRLRRQIDNGEREAVGDFQSTVNIHANDRTGSGGRERLGAMLDDFHGHLYAWDMSM